MKMYAVRLFFKTGGYTEINISCFRVLDSLYSVAEIERIEVL